MNIGMTFAIVAENAAMGTLFLQEASPLIIPTLVSTSIRKHIYVVYMTIDSTHAKPAGR